MSNFFLVYWRFSNLRIHTAMKIVRGMTTSYAGINFFGGFQSTYCYSDYDKRLDVLKEN